MATYTAPTTRTTGALISASIWNTDIVENLKYFKDAPVFDGDISVGDDIFLASTGAVINFASGDVTITHSTNTLTFAGAASGYIFNDGNVGIGTSSPSGLLDVSYNTNATGWQYLQQVNTGASAAAALNVFNTGGGDLRVTVNSANNTGGVGASGVTIFQHANAAMGFGTNGLEAMRINPGQELMIGYTTDQGAYKLQVNSQIFATNATIATSDGRFKTDVQPVREGLAAVNALQPVQFRWKKHPVHNFIDGTDVGFIAQDVRTALTGRDYTGAVVTQNGSGESEFLGMADSKLIPLLVAAVQELSAEVNALKAH